MRCAGRLPPAPPRPWRGTGHHVHALADRPQVNDVGFHTRETVIVLADAAVLVAGDPAGEGDLAVLLEQRRVVEAGPAGDEAATDVVTGPVRAAGVAQPRRDHLEAGAVGLWLALA